MWKSAEEIDEALHKLHEELGPRWRFNDPRFSEDLPDHMYQKHIWDPEQRPMTSKPAVYTSEDWIKDHIASKPKANEPTFSKFKASRKSMTWQKCVELLKIDEKYTDAPRAIVYMNSVYIEDFIFRTHRYSETQQGRYVLVLERNVYVSNSLTKLEKILYNWMIEEETY